ncbi:MAG: BrnT family toxin [Anaerolineales bacterium]
MPKPKPLQFEWDPAKAETNDAKYGVTFDEAASIFKDRYALFFDDLEHSQKTKRELVIAKSKVRDRLLTCFFERTENKIHIVGARVSTHRERQDYDENAESKKNKYKITTYYE